MKKNSFFRAIALIGAILLAGMIVGTLVVAVMDFEGKHVVLQRMLVLDFLIPALLYGYTIIYRVAKGMDDRASYIARQELQENSSDEASNTEDVGENQ